MPNTKNVAVVKDLEEKFSRAKSVVLTNYAGLTVKQQTKLRTELKKAQGELIVAKNTLVARVLGKDELNQSLQGQTGVLFSYGDEISALKALVQFAKDNNLPEIKQGLLNGVVYSQNQVIELSKLPGKDELIAMLLGRLNAPASKLVGVLTGVTRNLVYGLNAIAEKKKASV